MQKIIHHIEYQIYDDATHLSALQFNLLQSALDAAKSAYAPYSNFYVGAAILMDNDSIITGCNQENASYPCGICAERAALYSIISIAPGSKILKLAVAIQNETPHKDYPPSPCGICRQVMCEFESINQNPIELILGHPAKTCFVFKSCKDILPFSFDANFLKN